VLVKDAQQLPDLGLADMVPPRVGAGRKAKWDIGGLQARMPSAGSSAAVSVPRRGSQDHGFDVVAQVLCRTVKQSFGAFDGHASSPSPTEWPGPSNKAAPCSVIQAMVRSPPRPMPPGRHCRKP